MAKNVVPAIIDKLEDHFASPEYTSAIGDFLSANVPSFTTFDASAEQPLHYYQVFEEYKALVENSVESFLGKEGSCAEDLFSVISKFQQSEGSACYTCIDYLVACTEYPSFLQLVEDVKRMDEWDLGCDDEVLEVLEENGSQCCIAEPKIGRNNEDDNLTMKDDDSDPYWIHRERNNFRSRNTNEKVDLVEEGESPRECRMNINTNVSNRSVSKSSISRPQNKHENKLAKGSDADDDADSSVQDEERRGNKR